MRANYFHLHLVSDATGETLISVARAASAQYSNNQSIEHVHSLIRTDQQLDKIMEHIEREPGIVLYTLVNKDHGQKLEAFCNQLMVPVCNILSPVFDLFQSYLGSSQTRQAGAQHSLDKSYFNRIEAMNFTLAHDDGQSPDTIAQADIVLIGISRTSKTPTSVYLANRGLRVANIPIVPNLPLPAPLQDMEQPTIIGLIASPRHILQIRQNRILGFKNEGKQSDYLNRHLINEEIAHTKRLCQTYQWPILDVTRKSIEETAAEIFKNHQQHREKVDQRRF